MLSLILHLNSSRHGYGLPFSKASLKTLTLAVSWTHQLTYYSHESSHQRRRQRLVHLIKNKGQPLYEDIKTMPNLITLGRILTTPMISGFILNHYYKTALALFTVSAASDFVILFDTLIGSILDPFSDKILIGVMAVSLSWVALVPWQLTALILTRDVALIMMFLVHKYQSLPKPVKFSAILNLDKPSIEIRPSLISKANTVLQLLLFTLSLASPVFHFENYFLLPYLQYIVGFTTAWSGLDYLFLSRAIRKIKSS